MSASMRLLAMGVAASRRMVLRATFAGDSTTSLGPADTGQASTVNPNVWGRIGGAAYTPTAMPAARAWYDAGVSDGRPGVTLSVFGANSAGLAFRLIDASNYWFARVNAAGGVNVFRVVAGASTQLLGLGNTAVAGDRFEVDARGSLISVILNESVIGTLTDATHQTATRHGMYINNATGWRLTDFRVLR